MTGTCLHDLIARESAIASSASFPIRAEPAGFLLSTPLWTSEALRQEIADPFEVGRRSRYPWIVMDIQLPPAQEFQLNELTIKTGRGTGELVQEAIARPLAHNEWFRQQVQIGIDQIARGEFIAEDEMDARVERMLRS